MKFSYRTLLLAFILFLAGSNFSGAQSVISGEVSDEFSGDPLIGASIFVEGTTDGTVTDFDGKFELKTDATAPFQLTISYLGYNSKVIEVTDVSKLIKVSLEEAAVTTEVVEVSGRRITERQQQSALTMESLDNIAIKETPAANFYDGLGSLKEVDLTAASLGFKIINTRGFNSTSPVRSLQIIDGVDNQSPGLNFSLGNFLGASELDVNRVNLIVGASSAFYGPNAFNGVISMETKNPFLHKGLSVMAKGGDRNLLEAGIRWADVINNKKGLPFLGYKFNIYGFQANDWVADNFDPVFDTETGRDNPGGYDAVNIYGDEYSTNNDFSNPTNSTIGLGIIHRRGYEEEDLVDYDSENLKAGLALHFRLQPDRDLESPELILSSNFSTGTTVYQGDNRYSLRNIQFFQHRLEINKRNNYFLRFYMTHEDAGDSYDPYFTALLLQQNAKTGNRWRSDYLNYWSNSIIPRLQSIEGYPRISQFPGDPEGFRAARDEFLQQPFVQDSLFVWHDLASNSALMGNPVNDTRDFLEPGTPEFQAEFDSITSRIAFEEGGTRFFDRSALYHGHGEYTFNDVATGGSVTGFDITVGANARLYEPDSRGSILLDTFGRDISTFEYGVYTGGVLELNNRVKLTASFRMDKNQNFDYLFSPAGSVVYNPDPNHTLRASFSSAIRNPTLADQYLFYNVGPAILIGNLDGFNDLITLESFLDYTSELNADTLDRFDVAPIKPERVRTFELGYRTTLFSRLYFDMTYYYSFYQDFIGFNIGLTSGFDPSGQPRNTQVYRVAANAQDRVTTQGYSIGFNYYFWKKYVFNGNYSWNKLNTQTDDPIIPAFNTPEHKYNVGFSGRDITINLGSWRIPSIGFNVNYKWIDSFIFEGSPQFTGFIPSYALLDAQVNWRSKKLNTTFKLGASNLLNEQTFQTYGGPRIGRLAYFSVLYDWKKK